MSMDHQTVPTSGTEGCGETATASPQYAQQPMQQPTAGGPVMGQPHFSAQIPGAEPFQGAPNAYAQYQPQSGFYTMGEKQVGQMPPPSAQAPQPQMPLGQPMYQQPIYQQPVYQQPVYQTSYQAVPGSMQPPQYTPYAQPGYVQSGHFQPAYGQPAPQPSAQAFSKNVLEEGGENRYGELYGLIHEAAEGNPDVSRFLNFFQSSSTDFWKGALVGVGLTLLLTNDTIKGAIAGGVSGLMGVFEKNAEDKEAEEDRKAEEEAAKEK